MSLRILKRQQSTQPFAVAKIKVFAEELRKFVNEHFDKECDDYFAQPQNNRVGHVFELLCKLDAWLSARDRAVLDSTRSRSSRGLCSRPFNSGRMTLACS